MNTKKNKIIYWISTGLLTILMLVSASMYIFNNEMASESFIKLGFPTYIIYPLAIAKILGVIAILTKKSQTLKEWAYAGFFFNFILGASAHLYINDGEFIPVVVAILFLMTSYKFDKKVFNN